MKKFLSSSRAKQSFAHKPLNLLLLTSIAAASHTAIAASPANPATLSTVVVSAGHLPQDVSEVYQGVSVVTRADLDRLQTNNVLEVLQTLPGVTINQSGGKGGLSGFFIRGAKSSQSLVLIDGVRAASASSGAAALETLSVDQIERIEVIRGARSSQYGADAIGGVIHVFTRQATQDGWGLRARVAHGSLNAWERSLGATYQNGATQASINITSEEMTDHDRSRSPIIANQDDDAFRNHALSLNLSHKLSDAVKISLSHLDHRVASEYDYGWDGAYPFDEFTISNTSAALDWGVNDVWSTRVEIGRNDNDNINAFDDVPNVSFFRTDRVQTQWLNTLDLSAHQVQLGLDHYRETLDSTTAFAVSNRDNAAAFAQYRASGAKASAEIGVRVDDNSIYGDFTSWNLGTGLTLSDASKLFFTYSEAFRAPTFSELYYPGYDNPNLKPEVSRNLEVKYTHALSTAAQISASIYQTKIDEAIVNNDLWIPHNIGKVEIQGAEVEWTQQFDQWRLTANASHMDARDQQTGNFLNRRPKKTLNLEVSRALGDWNLGASVYGAGASWDDPSSTRKISGYALLNTRVTYQINSTLIAALKIDNLLDKTYSTALASDGVWPNDFYNGYNELGRTGLLSLTWTPKF